MSLLGHSDTTLTMLVYQQVLDMGGAAVQELERMLGCKIPGGLRDLLRARRLGTNGHRARRSPRRTAAITTAQTG
jgi:hypothetical protein